MGFSCEIIKMNIILGSKVQDKVTGFTGIATAKVEYLNGCIQYCVKPKVGEDGKMPEGSYIDHQQLVVIEGATAQTATNTGGPQMDTPQD